MAHAPEITDAPAGEAGSPPEHTGHLLPDRDWAQVVRDAERILAEHQDAEQEDAGGETRFMLASATPKLAPIVNMPNNVKHNGMSGIPTQLLVQHSAECPLRGGYAQSLTQWANTPLSAGGPVASWHVFVDPIARVRMVPWYLAAWHASYANPFSIGIEVAGYARFSAAEWLTADGLRQLENLAHEWAYWSKQEDIPLKWLSNADVDRVMAGNRSIKGFATHRQIDKATRTDPGNNFPYTRLMDRIKQIRGVTVATPTKPPAKPAPKPAGKITGTSYTVVKGDTLSSIGERAGKKWQDIAAWNKIKSPYEIKPGQKLRLTKPAAPKPKPVPAEKIVWRMDPGEDLNKVQRHYNGPSVAAIAKANGITDYYNIPVGKVLTIPGRLEWLVKAGDTWEKIARHYVVSVAYVKSKNPGVSTLRPGQVLRIQ